MIKINEFKKLVRLFTHEILFKEEYTKLNILSIIIDKKDKAYRIVLILKENSDTEPVHVLAKKYFKENPYKIITRAESPENSASLYSGKGVRHINSGFVGTLGGFFNVQSDPHHTYGISNNHIIANLNYAQIGDTIVYNNNIDAGNLFRFIPLKYPPETNNMDAALFRIHNSHNTNWTPQVPIGFYSPKVNLGVFKVGNSTGRTEGIVTGIEGAASVPMNGINFNFTNIFAIKGIRNEFSRKGDSGSVVMTHNQRMVGIVFAKHYDYCWALPVIGIKPLLK